MVWCLKQENPDSGEADVTLFNSEKEAFQAATNDIQFAIADSWDMSDYDQASAAKTINDLTAQGNYARAVRFWNDCETNSESSYPVFYTVHDHQIVTQVQTPTIHDLSFFIALCDDEEEEEEEEIQISVDDLEDGDGFVSTVPGAYCRGAHKEWNEYASADRYDGTYLCKQCRMFRQVFGGIKKP